LALWNEIKANNTLDIEASDEHVTLFEPFMPLKSS